MARGTWWTTVHGVTKSWTQLNNQAQAHNNKSIEKQVKETFSNMESELGYSLQQKDMDESYLTYCCCSVAHLCLTL